jgi:CCR4-NOT complex subunit CAF16
MRDGSFVIPPVPWPFSGGDAGTGLGPDSGLYTIALAWLKEDQEVRRAAEKAAMVPKTRGSRVSIST